MPSPLVLPPLPAPLHEVFTDTTRHRVVNGPRQMGKDYLGFCYAVEKAWAGDRGWWVSNVFPNSEQSFRLAKYLLAGVPVVKIRESDRELRFPSGGSITYKTADAGPNNLRGPTLDFLVANEWAFADPDGEIWNVVSAALAVKRAPALFISTPNGVGDAWHRMVQRGDPTHSTYDVDWKSWKFNSSHSAFITPQELASKRRTMPELTFRQEYNGEFLSGAGARVKREWIKRAIPPSRLELTMGVDLASGLTNKADWTAAVIMGRDANGTVWIVDAQRMRGSMGDIVSWIRNLAEQYRPVSIAIESLFFQRWVSDELLIRTNLPVKPVRPTKDKVTRFSGLEVRFQNDLVRLGPSVPQEFEEELLSFPEGEHDDWCDAAAYAHELLTGPGDWSRYSYEDDAGMFPTIPWRT